MADADPIDAIALAEGERVLWQGRPGFGTTWADLRPAFDVGLVAWLVASATFVPLAWFLATLNDGLRGVWPLLSLAGSVVVLLSLLIAPFVVVSVLARVVGPYHLSLLSLGLCGPILAFRWSDVALARGWQAALDEQTPGDFFAAAVLVGLPLARIGFGVLRQKSLVYVLTDRRAAAVRAGAGAPRLRWSVPLVRGRWLQARVLGRRGQRRGHIEIGWGPERQVLQMIDEPDRVLALAREALASPADPSQPEGRG